MAHGTYTYSLVCPAGEKDVSDQRPKSGQTKIGT